MASPAHEQFEFIGVYADQQAAERAADAATAAGALRDSVRIGDARDEREELRAEMREETSNSFTNIATTAPITKEASKGMAIGIPVAAVIGAVIGLVIGLYPWANVGLAFRLVVGVICGAAAGALVGFYAGALTAKGPAEKLAAEQGVTLRVVAPDEETAKVVARRLADAQPIRLDSDGNIEFGWDTMSTEGSGSTTGTAETLKDRVVQGSGDWSGAERAGSVQEAERPSGTPTQS